MSEKCWSFCSGKITILIFISIIISAAFLRLWDLDLRPLHNDEAVNHLFFQRISQTGYYEYSHENYHGPLYFYVSWLFFHFFGDDEIFLRLSAVLTGLFTIAVLPLLLGRKRLPEVLWGGFLIGVSASAVYYSRYAIHESLFVLGGLITGLSLFRWLETGNKRWCYAGALGLWVMICCKETFIITLFCLFIAGLSVLKPQLLIERIKTSLPHICLSLLLTGVLTLMAFSALGTWYGGLREMFLAVPQWVGRNESDTGHFKPWLYYFRILFGTTLVDGSLGVVGIKIDKFARNALGAETQHLFTILAICICTIMSILGRSRSLFSRDLALERFLALWSLLSVITYSFVSYKTPWLIINVTIPASLLLGVILLRLLRSNRGLVWKVSGVLFVLGFSSYGCWLYNFEHPYGKKTPFSYVHSHKGMLDLVKDLDAYAKKKGENRKTSVLVGVSSYWPLPYYLRNLPVRAGYIAVKDPKKYKKQYRVIILNPSVEFDDSAYRKKYYRLSDSQEANVYYRVETNPMEY